MRKLLVASQKGGVGKTTSSINLAAATARAGSRVFLLDADPLSSISAALNLAQHPRRQTLRNIGTDMPGALCCDVVPGLDVFSPYEDGICTDGELDELIGLFQHPEFQAHYDCLIVDTPPFLGANPRQLLAPCDEFVLVMRAEPMAYRTLPAFLELVQRSKKDSPIKLKGIVLTLPEGDVPGGPCERELRGRLGTRILPQVVPNDDEMPKALRGGLVAIHANPDSPAAVAYATLAATLNLGADAKAERSHGASGLLLAAARHLAVRSREATIATATSASVPTPEIPELPPVLEMPALPPVVPSRHLQLPTRSRPMPRPNDGPPPQGEVVPAPPAAASFQVPGAVWIGLGVLLGVGLRFVQLPASLLPIVVGMAVALFVVLLLRFLLLTTEKTHAAVVPATNGHVPESLESVARGDVSKKDGSSRLAALAHRVGAAYRGPDANDN